MSGFTYGSIGHIDHGREQYEADRADFEAKEDRIMIGTCGTTADTTWKCCGCYKPCAVDIIYGTPFSHCCMKPAYNADDVTNATDTVSTTARLRTLRDIEGGA